jgi:hypothetical protein
MEEQEKIVHQAITDMVVRDFGLEAASADDEEALLAATAARVGYLLSHDHDFLMGMLYRLDVLEEKIKAALGKNATDPAHIALAKLILERQKQRYQSKLNSFKPLPDDLKEWAW